MTPPPQHDAELLARRRASLNPAYRLFFQEPLHVVRGSGVWLYDADGNAYLDAYNNVVSLGHSHPHVVEAVARQAARLNTHTRYLTTELVDYAERLLAHFPPDLDNLTVTCTGTEANELAYRMACLTTGGRGFIVTENAYHGWTTTLSTLSTVPGRPRDGSVRAVRAPNRRDATAGCDATGGSDATGRSEAAGGSEATGRSEAAGGSEAMAGCDATGGSDAAGGSAAADVGARFGADVAAAAADLRRSGITPAALIVDTIFSGDGILPDPAGFLQPAVEAIRREGGLFIADEVQAGFARLGPAMWGFARHGVMPDIVTLGKPMGNGYPLGGVVTRHEIASDFSSHASYFNTYGGNPVACVAGTAVLDVIEHERLAEHVAAVGTYLAGAVRHVAARHRAVDDVRAAGLFLGLEMAPQPGDGRDATTLAAAVQNGMRRHRVLVGTTGPTGNVVKIRPPLIFQRDDVELLVATLDEVLAET